MQKKSPIDLTEEFFGEKLTAATKKAFLGQSLEKWSEFSHFYWDYTNNYVRAYDLVPDKPAERGKVRLYFDSRLDYRATRISPKEHLMSGNYGFIEKIAGGALKPAEMVEAARKYLLFADQVFVRDSFWMAFDAFRESVDRRGIVDRLGLGSALNN